MRRTPDFSDVKASADAMELKYASCCAELDKLKARQATETDPFRQKRNKSRIMELLREREAYAQSSNMISSQLTDHRIGQISMETARAIHSVSRFETVNMRNYQKAQAVMLDDTRAQIENRTRLKYHEEQRKALLESSYDLLGDAEVSEDKLYDEFMGRMAAPTTVAAPQNVQAPPSMSDKDKRLLQLLQRP